MSVFYDLSKTPRNILNQAIVRAIISENNGALFDPSDLSALYQDAAGTIPVTAVEQPVGLMLDKSGNNWHATQSVTASRPTLSARYNLYTKTNPDAAVPAGFSVGFGSGTFTHNLVDWTGPVLTNHKAVEQIQTVSGRSFLQYTITLQANTTYTISSYFDKTKSFITSGTNVVMVITDFDFATGETYKTLSSADSNGRISLTFTTGADGVGVLKIGCGCTGVMSGKLVFSGWQIVSGTAPGPYQRVNTATDYDTNPALFPKYLKFDGVDDYLNLPYMGLYAGGSASVIALTNLHTTTYHEFLLTEMSTVAIPPAYLLQRKSNSLARIGDFIRNDAGQIFVDTNSIPIVQANTVLLSTVDSGTSINTYINGVVGSSIGYTRAGTLTINNTTIGASVSTTTSNYASMKLYSLIITKSALTDAQRIKCERYAASKAGVIL